MMTDAEAIKVLDAWTSRDPEARTWTMKPYVAGFVGCRLEDDRKRTFGDRWSWEFGDQNDPENSYQVARRIAAETIIKGLPTEKYPTNGR